MIKSGELKKQVNLKSIQGEKCERKSKRNAQDFFGLFKQTVKEIPEKLIKGTRSLIETYEIINEKVPERTSSFTHVNKQITENLLEIVERMK